MEQETVVGTLEDIVVKVDEYRLIAPVVIVVGNVVTLREKLRWFDNRPLFNKRILVTRARRQASTLSRLLAEHGAQPVELPAIDIQTVNDSEPLDQAISNLAWYHWIIFTSVNGVDAFWQRLQDLNRDNRTFNGIKIGAIGPATAKALEHKGIISDYVPEVYTSDGIIAGLENWDIAGQRFLLPRADIADKELVWGISNLGASVHEVIAYQTVPVTDAIIQAKKMIISGGIDVITFTSSSTVSNLVAVFGGEPMVVNRAKVACIGPKTAATANKVGLRVDIVAGEQTIPGLVTAIEDYFDKEA
jgi:uroporphyrinogen III methyltransferase/synthase